MSASSNKRCVVISSSEDEDEEVSADPVEDQLNTPVRKRLRHNDAACTAVSPHEADDSTPLSRLRKPREHLALMSPEVRRAAQRAVVSGDAETIQISDATDEPEMGADQAEQHTLEDSSDGEEEGEEEDEDSIADQDSDPNSGQNPDGAEVEPDLKGFVVADVGVDLEALQVLKDEAEYQKQSHWECFRKVLRNELRLVTFPGDPPEPGLRLAEDTVYGELKQFRSELLSFSWVTAFTTTRLRKHLEQLPGLVVASWEESDRNRPDSDEEREEGKGRGDGDGGQGDDNSGSGSDSSSEDDVGVSGDGDIKADMEGGEDVDGDSMAAVDGNGDGGEGNGSGDGEGEGEANGDGEVGVDGDGNVNDCEHKESEENEDGEEDDDLYAYRLRKKRPCSLCSRRQNIRLEKAVEGLNSCESYHKWLFRLFNDLVECAKRLNGNHKPTANNARYGPKDAKRVTYALRDMHPLPEAEESDVDEVDTAPERESRHPNDVCCYCKQIGHWVVDCPNTPQSMACHFCEQIGHKVENCRSRVHT